MVLLFFTQLLNVPVVPGKCGH